LAAIHQISMFPNEFHLEL